MLSLNQVSFAYQRHAPVLDSLSCEIKKGGVYGLLGNNGVGKTTLLHLIAGLLFPNSGSISLEGQQPFQRLPSFLRRIFYVPVDFDLPSTRVDAFRKAYEVYYPDFDAGLWSKALQLFEVEPRQYCSALSFGQKKKVLLSFAIATNCSLLLLDEPTDGLDIPSKDNFRRLLSKYICDDRTAIIATHHVSDFTTLLDHLMVLQGKKLAMCAPIAEIANRVSISYTSRADEKAFYVERNTMGFQQLTLSEGGEDEMLDLEFLYKALSFNPELIKLINNE